MISIIVPIYKGERYIPKLISQCENNQDKIGKDNKIELILSNDSPSDKLPEYKSGKIDIVVINTKVNRGIHGARVEGLRNAHGEYVVFLDQDDYIESDFCVNQLNTIGEADCVVCRCIHENKPYYNYDNPFEKMMTFEYMLHHGDSIVSPGQVLIKKDKIPCVWTENVMTANGADDFMLWLAMLAAGGMFAVNNKILFTHTVSGDNTSWNAVKQYESEEQMVALLEETGTLTKDQANLLMDTITKKRIGILGKFRKMFFTLNTLDELRNKGITIKDYLKRNGIRKLAIYGAGYIGHRIYSEIKEAGIDIIYMDRNAEYMQNCLEVPVFTMEDAPDDVDIIIVSLVENYGTVEKTLAESFNAEVCQIMTLLSKMENEK